MFAATLHLLRSTREWGIGVLDRLATELQRNFDVFVKCDLYNWASDITAKNKPNSDFGSNHTIPELN